MKKCLLLLLFYAGQVFANVPEPIVADLFSGPSSVRVSGNIAYGVCSAGLLIYDVTDRAHPRFLSQLLINNSDSFSLEIAPPYIYVLSGSTLLENTSLTVVDARDPSRPRIASQYLDLQGARSKDLVVRGHIVMVSNANSIDFLDASDPARLQKISSVRITSSEGFVDSFSIQGSVLFAVWGNSGHQGLAAIESATPASPQVLSKITFSARTLEDFARWPVKLVAYQNMLYVSRISADVAIFDASNPGRLRQVGTLNVTGSELFSKEGRLFIQLHRINSPFSIYKRRYLHGSSGKQNGPVMLQEWT